ncbi:MAG: hypothetical protein ABL993_12700 [Vicinamibacterales bacterium]
MDTTPGTLSKSDSVHQKQPEAKVASAAGLKGCCAVLDRRCAVRDGCSEVDEVGSEAEQPAAKTQSASNTSRGLIMLPA